MEIKINIDVEEIEAKITKQVEEHLLDVFCHKEGQWKSDVRQGLERRIFDKLCEDLAEQWYRSNATKVLQGLDTTSILNTTNLLIGKDIRDKFRS